MRVVSGMLRGMHMDAICENNIRPTTDKVKESVFNILQFEIAGKSFLDLFGGTGQIGIEAISRGASKVVIVDNNQKALGVIRKNVSRVKVGFDIKVVASDAIEFLRSVADKFDIVFLDPPYGSELLYKVAQYIDYAVKDGGVVVVEMSTDKKFSVDMGSFKRVKEYKYGNIVVGIYRILK